MKTPIQLVAGCAKDFDRIRSLRNNDQTWMKLYFRSTRQSDSILSSLYVIGVALVDQARMLNIHEMTRWIKLGHLPLR